MFYRALDEAFALTIITCGDTTLGQLESQLYAPLSLGSLAYCSSSEIIRGVQEGVSLNKYKIVNNYSIKIVFSLCKVGVKNWQMKPSF